MWATWNQSTGTAVQFAKGNVTTAAAAAAAGAASGAIISTVSGRSYSFAMNKPKKPVFVIIDFGEK